MKNWKQRWHRFKYSCSKYWIEAWREGSMHFKEGDPWHKALWNYIYFENSVFKFFYKRYCDIAFFIYKIKRIYSWSKLLWNSVDYDGTAIFEILQYKLERLEATLRDGSLLNRKVTAAEIEYVLILLDKVQRYDGFPCPYLEEAKKQTKDRIEAYKIAYKLHEEDVIKLFTFIAKHHRNWWD